jgi:hypothetical protein
MRFVREADLQSVPPDEDKFTTGVWQTEALPAVAMSARPPIPLPTVPHTFGLGSLGDRKRLVSMRGLTRPDASRCHPAKALGYDPQRNSRLGFESPRQLSDISRKTPGPGSSEGRAADQTTLAAAGLL